MLVAHLGGVKPKEVYTPGPATDASRLYDNHLGVVGMVRLLEALALPRPLAVISEFGEELGPLRRDLVEAIESALARAGAATQCIAADVGTHVSFEPAVRLVCDHHGCDQTASIRNRMDWGRVVHRCAVHPV